jgi:hypothetical protein
MAASSWRGDPELKAGSLHTKRFKRRPRLNRKSLYIVTMS